MSPVQAVWTPLPLGKEGFRAQRPFFVPELGLKDVPYSCLGSKGHMRLPFPTLRKRERTKCVKRILHIIFATSKPV